MSYLIFSFLGPVKLSHPDVGELFISKRKTLALLVYLVIEADHPHTRESLLGLLWPEYATAAAQNNLRVTCSELQKSLAETQENALPYLISSRLDVQFNPLSQYELDVTRFRSLINACRSHIHPGQPEDCAECAARLAQAVKLVRGPFLEGFSLPDCPAFDEWLFFQRERLHQQVTSVLEQLVDFHERAGDAAEAESYTRRLLELDPLREQAHRQLMRLLAGADQRSAALAQYEALRHLLATELGLAPSVETMTLAEQIRALAPFESHSALVALPPVLTRFFGRQQESARLVDLLSRRTVRLVTLTGPGGVGKSRLALEVAHRMAGVFAHDICFVELAGITDESSVDDAVAASLHLQTRSGRSSTNALVDYLRDRSMLLVLDNCEHLVKACAHLVQTLCRAAAGLTVLITSRIPLHLDEEHVVRLEPFATPTVNGAERLTVADSLRFDSVQLFTNRAAQSLLHFRLNEANVLAVAQICQQLDGIPLAIEIAAAQVRALPVEAIAERLGQRFAWLNRQLGETLPRQRTLHTLIDWSYGLLSDRARSFLDRLAVFAGGWTLEAAEAVSMPGEPCAERLAELVDHSLVVFGSDGEHRRYTMHETIRQFAQEQLRGSGQEANALACHARYFAQLVSHAAANPAGQTLPERMQTIVDDHDNLRRAFEWLVVQDGEQALALVAQLGTQLGFWELGGFFQEGRRWLQSALEATQGAVSLPRGYALLAAAELSSAITDFEYGLQCVQQAQQLFQQLGDPRGEIDARVRYCDLAGLAGKNEDLEAHGKEALRMAEQIAYRAGVAKARGLLGSIAYDADMPEAALQYHLPNVAVWHELDSPFDLARAHIHLGVDLLEIGEYAAARQAFLEARDGYRSLGYQRGAATAIHNLGETAYKMGEYAIARELLCESLQIRKQLGLPRGYPYSFELLAQVNAQEGRYEQAVQLLAAAETLRYRIGAPLETVAQKHVTAVLVGARTQLSHVAYELAWSQGVAMTTEQAIAFALS